MQILNLHSNEIYETNKRKIQCHLNTNLSQESSLTHKDSQEDSQFKPLQEPLFPFITYFVSFHGNYIKMGRKKIENWKFLNVNNFLNIVRQFLLKSIINLSWWAQFCMVLIKIFPTIHQSSHSNTIQLPIPPLCGWKIHFAKLHS